MDFIDKSMSRYIEGGRAILDDIQSFNPQQLIQTIRDFDYKSVDWKNIDWSLVLLGTIITGIITFIILARILPEPTSRQKSLFDTDIVHDPNAPPIPPPTEIISLRIYPIKSCRGLEVSHTRLRKSGLSLDRNWMFIDKADRKFLTIRSDPNMTLIDTTIVDGEIDPKTKKPGDQFLHIKIHGQDDEVSVPAFPTKEWLAKNTTLSTVEIWGAETDAYEYGPEINKIFCDFFEKDVALVYKGPQPRNVAVNARKELYGEEVSHAFADVISLQIASEASIIDLNKRLQEKTEGKADELTIERFRPNIIVRGREDHPWEEDTWKRVRITTRIPEEEALYRINLDVVARCARCQVPNVNPDTAEKHPKEPWDEL